MDPDAALARIADALASGDKAEAREAKADLVGWLRAGGFSPKWARFPVAHAYVIGKKIPKKKGPKFFLAREPLDRGGYTKRGVYFGTGAPLFRYSADDVDAADAVFQRSVLREYDLPYSSDHDGYIRAAYRAAAKTRIRRMYPGARF